MVQFGPLTRRAFQVTALSAGLVLPSHEGVGETTQSVIEPPPPPAAVEKAAPLKVLVTPPNAQAKESAALQAQPTVVTQAPSTPPLTLQPPTSAMTNIVHWVTKDFSSFSSPMEAARSIGLSLLSIAGGLLAITAGFRGCGKLFVELKAWRKANRNVADGCLLSSPSLSELIILRRSDKWRMIIRNHTEKPLDKVFPGPKFADVFESAVRKCTKEEPFPQLHFSKVFPPQPNRSRFTPQFIRDWQPAVPDVETMMRLCNRALVNLASAELNPPRAMKPQGDHWRNLAPSNPGDDAVRIAAEANMDFPEMLIIPIAELSERWSTLVFVAVYEETFKQFGDAEFVAQLREDCPKFRARIDQIELAHRVNHVWKERGLRGEVPGNGSDLFPSVTVITKRGDGAKAARQ